RRGRAFHLRAADRPRRLNTRAARLLDGRPRMASLGRTRRRARATMKYKTIQMGVNKKIALVAHDNKKRDLIEWAKYNRDLLAHHKVYATGTTGAVLEKELKFPIKRLESGPLGGGQPIGSKIVGGDIAFL